MKNLRFRIYMSLIFIIVFLLLFSNLGQNFKTNMFSYNNTNNCSNEFIKHWIKSSNQEVYLNNSSHFIVNYLKKYKVLPLKNKAYIYNHKMSIPLFKFESKLEVTSPHGSINKKYVYGKNFFEYFYGNIKSGVIKSKAKYCDSLDSLGQNPNEILLFNGYRNKSETEIEYIDNTLFSKGVKAVIVPSISQDLKYDSGIYDVNCKMSDEGLIKLVVSKSTFEDLKQLINKKYSIKIKSGSGIKQIYAKNIFGQLKGRSKTLKPLIIISFYDGIYKTYDAKSSYYLKYSIPPSITLDSIRSLNLQRIPAPDRNIIFVFLSGYMSNIDVLNTVYQYCPHGDYLILDGLGLSNKVILTYSKKFNDLWYTTDKFLRMNDFSIVSRNSFNNSIINYTYVAQSQTDSYWIPKYGTISKSGTFLLSLIGDECYNIGFLSGNIHFFIMIKKFIRNYTPVISFLTMVFLIIVVFRSNGMKK